MNLLFRAKMTQMLDGVVLGHQAGQWSERRWWRQCLPGKEQAETLVSAEMLTDRQNIPLLIGSPPQIETPGWVPTGFADNIPHIIGLGMAYVQAGKALTPDTFRDFMLGSRDWLLPQGVARSCVELMAEGMNPRIAGLYAPSFVSGCWLAWPVSLYHAGNHDDAYEDAVKLARTLNGGDIVELTGSLAAAAACALTAGADWNRVKTALLQKISIRASGPASLLQESLEIGRSSKGFDDLLVYLRSKDFYQKADPLSLGLMQSFYCEISYLEYVHTRSQGLPLWPEFLAGALMLPDTRFGVMIAAGIYAALHGTEWPSVWSESMASVFPEQRGLLISEMYTLIETRISHDLIIADQAALMAGSGAVEDSRLYDRILAGMLAGTAANAMGSPVEDRDYDWIAEKHGVVDTILDAKKIETEDDAAMAILWTETFLRCDGRIYTEDLADSFLEKMNPLSFYYDSQHSYHLLRQGLPAHACGHWNVVTGSALMGCNVVGMYHTGDPDLAQIDGMELAYHYQRGFDVFAAGILCAATAAALKDDATVESVLAAAVEAAPREPQCCFDSLEKREARPLLNNMLDALDGHNDVLEARQTIYDNFQAYNGQDPWEVVAYTLAIFKIAGSDVWQSMIGGTNIGRDSDTIACQATTLSACMTGMQGVPDFVLSLFNDQALQKYRDLAAGMVALQRRKCRRIYDNANDLGFMTPIG